MTIQELLNLGLNYENEILYFFLSIPVITLILSLFKKKYSENKNFKIIYSIIIYTISIPGILSLILALYSIFILGNNILELNLLVYFVPLLSMGITYFIIQKIIGLKNIPGFGKITSLLILIFLTFIIVFVLQKMFFGIVFVGSLKYILIAFIIIFVGMKYAFDKLVK